MIAVLVLLGMTACEKYVQYSPSEVRLQAHERDLNEKNISRLQQLPARDTFRFALTGDSQRFYDELEDFVAHVNRRGDISLVLLNGDITDFGQNREYQWVARILNRLQPPFIGIIGNHDMLGNGLQVYRQMFGPDNFSFNAGGNRFVCLNTNSREKNYDGSIPDLNWLSRQVADTAHCRNLFVVSHIGPSSPDFDQRMTTGFAQSIAGCPKARMSLHSHSHNFSFEQPFGDGIGYLTSSSYNKRRYVLVTVINEEVQYENVDY